MNKDILSLLDGLDVSSNEMRFFIEGISGSWDRYYKDMQARNIKLNEENNNKVLEQALKTIFEEQAEEPELEELEAINIHDFVLEYCRKEMLSFRQIFASIKDELADGIKFVVLPSELSDSKAKKKFDNAVSAYAHKPSGRSYDLHDYVPNFEVHRFNLLVQFDTTVFGSGKTGICFTDSFLVYKGIGVLPHDLYYYSKVESMDIDPDDHELSITGLSCTGENREYFKYNCYKITPKLMKVVDCVNKFINQPSLKLIKHLTSQ
ncbi:hypothetical protein HNR62_002766 [Oceanisphaera litoralis]|uniref:hypothetical protein n=1 Tax=Oceanisphaera litoralis TaxID=225144 RepID=UPI00195A0488|nr:hypothetical protein [Oceanisphaera litoralis]MBM7456864.1 hypothetical protein [Oceanisphaera litoralis]